MENSKFTPKFLSKNCVNWLLLLCDFVCDDTSLASYICTFFCYLVSFLTAVLVEGKLISLHDCIVKLFAPCWFSHQLGIKQYFVVVSRELFQTINFTESVVINCLQQVSQSISHWIFCFLLLVDKPCSFQRDLSLFKQAWFGFYFHGESIRFFLIKTKSWLFGQLLTYCESADTVPGHATRNPMGFAPPVLLEFQLMRLWYVSFHRQMHCHSSYPSTRPCPLAFGTKWQLQHFTRTYWLRPELVLCSFLLTFLTTTITYVKQFRIHVCCHLPLVCVYCFSIVYFYIVKYCHAYFVEGAIQILSVDWLKCNKSVRLFMQMQCKQMQFSFA